MRFIDRLKIRGKLLASAGVLLALMLVVGIVALQGLGSVNSVAGSLGENGAEPLAHLGVARAKTNENRAFLNNHILEDDASAKAELEEKVAANAKLVDEALTAVEASLQTPEGRAAYDQIRQSTEAYRAVREPTSWSCRAPASRTRRTPSTSPRASRS